MRLKKFTIRYFRSIKEITIEFPDNTPIILFGPNNVGKSNILKAMEIFLGEKYPINHELADSDYYQRDKNTYPQIQMEAVFDENYYPGNWSTSATNHILLTFNKENDGRKEHMFHDQNDNKLFISKEDREKCQFILTDANRDLSRQLSYFSQYSMLSRMAKKMHEKLIESQKEKLDQLFQEIKETFESVKEYKNFYDKLQNAFISSIDGFEHKLDIDLSAYDPNNYFKSLKIIAKDEGNVRSFDEFGTGEQQILLMAFMKAYAETFKGETFILGIEEPEAHLHPLAQRWLGKNISHLARSGVQVIITTHSPEFLSINNLEGFVRVVKDYEGTKVIQNNVNKLVQKCIELGSHPQKTTEENILEFYNLNTFYDQLKGFFARKIILVEGPTELYALPYYFERIGYDLAKNGVEIVDCKGKNNIARNYRLFAAYGYECFCLFDADTSNGKKNKDLANTFGFNEEEMIMDKRKFTCDSIKKYGYFGKDFETYMRSNHKDYAERENKIQGGKVLNAKIIAETSAYTPEFVSQIAEAMNLKK